MSGENKRVFVGPSRRGGPARGSWRTQRGLCSLTAAQRARSSPAGAVGPPRHIRSPLLPPTRHGAGRSGGKPSGCSQAHPYQHPQALLSHPSLRSCSPRPVPNDSLIPPSFSSSPPDVLPPSPPGHHAHSEPPRWPEQPWGSGLSPAASSLLICSDGHTVPHV